MPNRSSAADAAPPAPATSGEPTSGFLLGHGLFRTNLKYFWDPDSEPNAHMVIWGASGTGKSHLLRRVISYLHSSGKNVLVLDVHGDLGVDGENLLTLGGPTPQYGLNPFEFDPEHRSGPAGNIDAVIATMRKTYMKSMGPVQELVLRTLIVDVYRSRGILLDKPDTWSVHDFPNICDLRTLVETIQLAVESGVGGFAGIFRPFGELLTHRSDQIRRLESDLANGTEEVEAARAELQAEFDSAKMQLMTAFEVYVDREFGAGPRSPDGDTLDFENGKVALAPYLRSSAQRVLDSLSMYVTALEDHGIFHASSPPVVAGLNRFDLSGLSDQARVFAVDTLLERVFRRLRARGEYEKLAQRPRGARMDTMILVDEAQLVIPPTRKDAESSTQVINRLVSEARKFGAGLILVCQSPAVFPNPVLSNVARKIGLRTNANDIPAAKRSLGVAGDQLFNQAKIPHVAMYSTRAGDFEPIKLSP